REGPILINCAAVAGCVITRQRPGTAKGIIFMTLEDETGTSRVIISPDFYDKNRMVVLNERFVQVPEWFKIRTISCISRRAAFNRSPSAPLPRPHITFIRQALGFRLSDFQYDVWIVRKFREPKALFFLCER